MGRFENLGPTAAGKRVLWTAVLVLLALAAAVPACTVDLAQTPTQSPTQRPAQSPTQNPVQNPTQSQAQNPAQADLVVYDDALASGWQDWSYNDVTVDYANTSPVHAGSASIAVTYDGGWSGLQLGYGGGYLDVNAYDTLRFWVHGGSAGEQPVHLEIALQSGTVEQEITPQASTWARVDVSLIAHASREVYSIQWLNNSASGQPTYYLDDISFVNTGLPTPTPQPPTPGPALQVDAAAGRHPISPYVYGMNWADETVAADLNLPVRRWGGNSVTRYNWQVDVHNTGSDWYYENIPNDNDDPALLPDGSSADRFVEQNQRTGTETLLTVPLIGWTPNRRLEGHPYDCGFKVSVYGPQDDVDPWDTDCGNGEQGGDPITGNDPTDTSVAITTTFVISWIKHLTGKYGTAANGGVMFYDLDNEPMLWDYTHRDVHPEPTGYDEMRDRTWTYAAAVKAADPTAQTLGPVVWGWTAYFWSALDWAPGGDWWNNPLDRLAHGDVPFVEWYLQQMKDYEDTHGERILDYLDLHFYPPGVSLSPAGDAETQARRLRSTRLLWDPTYSEESWIAEPVYLIPRMKQWVADNYPGTKLAVTEYNWGAFEHINGALAQADVLGIFGREGLDLATLWSVPEENDPAMFAFRMYRNYDGQGQAFGETSVSASSSRQDDLSIYAALRAGDGALTVMVINKTGQPLSSTVTLDNFQPASSAQVYRYSPANLGAIVQEANQPITAGAFTTMFPANSVTLFVVPPGTPLTPRAYLPVLLRDG